MKNLAFYDEILAEILSKIFIEISAAELPLDYSQVLFESNIKILIRKNIQRKNLLLLRLVSRQFKKIFDSIVLPTGHFHFLLNGKNNIFITSKQILETEERKYIFIVNFNEFLSLCFNPDHRYFIHLGITLRNEGNFFKIQFLLVSLSKLIFAYILTIENDNFSACIVNSKSNCEYYSLREFPNDKNKLSILFMYSVGEPKKDIFHSDIIDNKINFIKEFLNSHHGENIPRIDDFNYDENKLFKIYEDFLLEEISNKKDLYERKITKDEYEYYIFLSIEIVKKCIIKKLFFSLNQI